MPTGTAIRDARRQLFDAAERLVARAGIQALTSRAVTAEAGCAKGVLHRHFTDFDSFLAELVGDRLSRVEEAGTVLQSAAGTGTVAAHLARVLAATFTPVTIAIVGLVTCRDDLRRRLRQRTPEGVPILTETATIITSYLALERDLGRVAPDADVATLALMVVGTAHLLCVTHGEATDLASLEKVVETVLTGG